jgi:hypothetical protein
MNCHAYLGLSNPVFRSGLPTKFFFIFRLPVHARIPTDCSPGPVWSPTVLTPVWAICVSRLISLLYLEISHDHFLYHKFQPTMTIIITTVARVLIIKRFVFMRHGERLHMFIRNCSSYQRQTSHFTPTVAIWNQETHYVTAGNSQSNRPQGYL